MTKRRASPRPTDEVRRLIVDSAAKEFAAVGFADTTMRSVAATADISLSVLHRHFPSKERLFSAALLAPFLEFFDEFSTAWSTQVEEPWDDERLLGELMRDLYRNLVKHRNALVTLLASGEASDSGLLAEARRAMAVGLSDLRAIGEHEATTRGWFSRDVVRHTNRLNIILITGLVLLNPLLSESEEEEYEEVLLDAAVRYALYGIRLSPKPAEVTED